MKYARVHRSYIQRPPAMSASAAALGTWTRLLSYASEMEAGGVIRGCRRWPARAWSVVGVTAAEVTATVKAGLAEWVGDDLRVDGYDTQAEELLRTARANGAKGGRPRNQGVNQSVTPLGNQAANPPETHSDPDPETETEERGRERGAPGSPPPSRQADPDQYSDLAAALSAIAAGYRDAHGANASEPQHDPADVRKHAGALSVAAHNAAELRRRAAAFYAADGTKPGDTYWRDCGWPLHLLVTQALTRVDPPSARGAKTWCRHHQLAGTHGEQSPEPLRSCPECQRIAPPPVSARTATNMAVLNAVLHREGASAEEEQAQ